MVCTLLAGVNVVAFAADDELTDTVAVQKFYNDAEKGGTGEHIYTIDESEISWYQSLPSWNDEGDAWLSPLMSSTPVYRVFNPNSGEHLWITDKGYVDLLVGQGWNQEQGIAFYSDDNKGVPVYRLWDGTDNLRSHHYTTDEGEIAWLVTLGWTVEDVAFYGVKEEEPGEKEMFAIQTGANKITVTTTTPFTGADEFTVSHGLIEDSIEDVDYDEDMCTIVITLDSNIIEAEYTVECSDEEYAPTTFEGEEAEVSMLAFKDTNLIAKDNTLYVGTAAFATLDQWGGYIEDPTLDGADFTIAGGKFAGLEYSTEQTGEGIGVLAVMAPAATATTGGAITGTPFTPGAQVNVSVVYDGNTKLAQETLTVSNAKVVSSMMVLDLMPNPENEDIQGKRVTTDRIAATGRVGVHTPYDQVGNYVLPVIAMDQYGNKLTAAELNSMWNNSLYITQTYNPLNPSSGIVQAWPYNSADTDHFPGFVDVDGVTVLTIVGDGVNSGTGVINFLSTGGFSTSKQINVEKNEVIDTVNVMVDDLQEFEPVPFLFTAVDQYGEAVDLTELEIQAAAVVDEDVPGIYFTGADEVSIVDFGGGVTEFTASQSTFGVDPELGCITITATDSDIPEIITVQTATQKFSSITKKVKPMAEPTDVKGLADGVTTTIGGVNQNVNLGDYKNIVFVDQYGKEFDNSLGLIAYNDGLQAAGSYYTVAPAGTPTYTTFTSGTGVVTKNPAKDGPGSDKYKVTLYDGYKALGNATVTVTVAGDAVSYTASLPSNKSLLYADGNDEIAVKLTGIDAKGNAFTVPTTDYNVVVDSGLTANSGAQISGDLRVALGTEYTGSATADVYVKGAKVDSVDVPFSTIAPMATIGMVVKADTLADLANPEKWSIYLGSEIDILDGDAFAAALNNGVLGITDDPTDTSYALVLLDQYSNAVQNPEVMFMDSNGKTSALAGAAFREPTLLEENAFTTVLLKSATESISLRVNGVVLNV